MSAAWGRRGPWYAGEWVWPVLVSLVVALLAGAAVVAAQSTRDDSGDPFLVATGPIGTTAPVTLPPPATEPVVTLPEEETVPTETEAPPPPPRQQRRTLISWPSGTDGYTIVISSIPKGARAEATRRAKAASDAGLDEVGLLDSSRYPSLVPGYLVVFSGVYRSRAEAERAIASARASGYNDAYAAQVAR